jgi:hypothetical protein
MTVDTRVRAFRVFDMLPEAQEEVDCVIHVSTFLEDKGMRRAGNAETYFRAARMLIEDLLTRPLSEKSLRVDLVISVNGLVTNSTYIHYLEELHSVHSSHVQIRPVVFQRPNVGWQWGGLWDIWLRYKHLKCKWWVTMESDLLLQFPCWVDIFTQEIEKAQEDGFKIAFLGFHQRRDWFIDTHEFYVPLPASVWRDWQNKPMKNVLPEDLRHIAGGFYFCTREFLEALDQTFHCFTFALGGNYEIDGIVHGEVGFSQKARALGFDYIAREEVYYPIEHGYLLDAVVAEEVAANTAVTPRRSKEELRRDDNERRTL